MSRIKLSDFFKVISLTQDGIIIQTIEKRKIKFLIHFTRVKNLESILTKGFLPRKYLTEQKISFCYNDKLRLDKNENATCFSIEYPNEFLLKGFQKEYNEDDWVIIQLDVQRIFNTHKGNKYYVNKNAGGATSWLKDPRAKTSFAFDRMFTEENLDSRHPYTRAEKKLKAYLPTNPQAEILIDGNISPECIKKICFENETHFNKFKEEIENKELLNTYDFVFDDFYFQSRDDINWEER